MAVTLQGSASVYESASATSAVIPYPAGIVAGELLLAQIAHSASTSISTAPSGWTNLEATAGSGGGPGIGVFYRWADGTETGSVTFATSSTAGRVTGLMQRWAGVSSAIVDTPVVENAAGIVVSYDSPSVSTATAGTLILHNIALNAGSASDINTPSGMTKVTGSTGTGRRLSVFTQAMPTPGSTGTLTWTQTSTTALQWTSASIALRPSGATVGPGLLSRIVGIPANPSTTGQVRVKVSNADSVRLRVSTDAAGTTGVVYSSSVTPNAQGDALLTVSGLTANTRYYYRVLMTNSAGEVVDSTTPQGRLKTAPAGQASFAFNFGSCNSGNSTTALNAMAARNDDFALHLGDLYYADGSGTGLANMRSKINAAISSGIELYSTTPMVLVPSDHEGMNNNTNAGSAPTAWTNWNIARSELYPTTNNYYTFVWGRVRFIVTDDRSYATDPAATDNSSKTYWGATQKQWVKDTITAATEPVIVIAQSGPWIGAAETGGDTWVGFTTERTEMANFFSTSGKNIIMLGGDMHALAADNGTNAAGGITVFQASPFNQTASIKGGPYSTGTYPTTGGSSVQQYGRVTVTDNGSSIDVNFKGYSASGTERLSLTKTYAVASTGNKVQSHRVEVGVVASTTTVNLHRSEINVTSGGGAAAPKLLSSAVSGVGSADPGPNVQNLEAGLTVQMDATAPGVVANYTWDQVAGPSVQLITSGLQNESCTYRVPYLKADADLVFRVVANYANGTKSGSGITRHAVVRSANLLAGKTGISPVGFQLIKVAVEETAPPVTSGYQPLGVAGDWGLSFTDDFNELNTAVWTPYWFTPSSQMNNVVTDPANVSIENGQLVLKLSEGGRGALVSSNPKDGVAGHTGFEFNYGYVEARIFLPGNASTLYNWPAFWTTGQQWPLTGECDIAEVTGWDPAGSLTSNYHYSNNGAAAQKNSGAIPGNWGGGWHTYGIHRTPTLNKVYYDGKLVWSYAPNDGGAPHYLVINVGASVAHNLVGDASKVRVDYVRYWKDNSLAALIPAQNLPGWNLLMAEDFNLNAALGEFSTKYPGHWNAANGQYDTSGSYGRPEPQRGIYDTNKTCTVHDSMLDIRVYTDGSGRPWIANPIPPIGTWGQLYGRYAVRFRSDTVEGFKMAWLLWPTSEVWADGEIDFPEAGLGKVIGGYSHNVMGTPSANAWVVNTGKDMSGWHTAIIEWTPTKLTFQLDDTVWSTTDPKAIPTKPMYWKLQTETELSATPPPVDATGHVYIDWVAVWSKA